MKLMRLDFQRDWNNKELMIGKAEFSESKDPNARDASTINLVLTKEQSEEIMEIIQTSLARTLKQASDAMAQSLKTGIELRKSEAIGRALPESW